jgi:hypothetical protein
MTNSALCLIDWNHFDNVGPRTNNHVEGFHYKLGEYIDNSHPNIYSLIETFKNIEMSCIVNYLQRKNGDATQSKRRKVDVARDKRILGLKSSLNNDQISILDYCRAVRLLFSLTNKKKEDEEIAEAVEEPVEIDRNALNQEIDNAFINFDPRNLNKVIISLHDIQTLSPCSWLNDTVIDYYFNLLLLDQPSYFSFSSYFYTSLNTKGIATVEKWYSKSNIFGYKKIFVPVLVSNHWILVVIDIETSRLILYDSFSSNYNQILNQIALFLTHMYKFYYNTELSWNFEIIHARSLPRQKNSYDCGMYVCKFAEFIINKREFTFSDNDMPRYRRKMVLSILRRKIITYF